MKNGIYKIRNLIDGKCYIGSAASRIGFKERWNTHRYQLRNNKHHSIKFQRAWNKYGETSFVFEILEICEPSQCIEREQFYLNTILFANCNDDRFKQLGYNVSRNAHQSDGFSGKHHSVKTRKKLSYIMHGHNNPFWGHQHTEKTKQKISQARTGHKISDNQKEKLAKLTHQEVRVIKRALRRGISQYKIAKRFNVAQPTISDIKMGRSWRHVECH